MSTGRWPTAKQDSRRNGELKSGSLGTNTPPPERKSSKFAALGKIFKPWKWRRKKKSEKIEKTAVDLERKISMRTSREELIRKGVLREPEESQQNHVPKIESVKESAEEETVDDTTEGRSKQDISVDGSSTVTTTTTSSGLAADVVASTQPAASSTSSTITTQAEITPTSINPTVSSSASVRPVVVPPPVVPPMELMQPPPPTYPPSADAQNSLVSFNDRVTQIIPAPIDDDDEEEEPEEPNSGPPAYETIPASEPDLSLRPSKSALKLKNGQAPPIPAPKPISHQKTSSLARPMNTSTAGISGEPKISPLPTPMGKPGALKAHVTIAADESDKENIPVMSQSHQAASAAAAAAALAAAAAVHQQGDYDNIPGDSDSSDEEIHYKDDDCPSGLAAKVARQDSLARFLNNRPSRRELIEKNIIPNKSANEKQTDREAIGSKLTRRLSLRPTPEELEQRNILYNQTNEERELDKEEKKRYLIRKLSFRPSIEELKERKIIKFNDYVEVTDAEMYDRRADKPWTRLTPKDKAAIRKELNEFKSKEMEVHEESKHLTRFHRP
ncbi:phosphatase and actin regulator 4-like isoform X3 [Haliotis rufescens]|uniref:phosphatase and actin regulator 4-like isoform X3 n=1 Tax=Haliotis rufescens TaxID=6454 RepID=UPI00201F587D|nr:phosphatase and actin regulator 4-like isoform X3 [Haliotis rufescens]